MKNNLYLAKCYLISDRKEDAEQYLKLAEKLASSDEHKKDAMAKVSMEIPRSLSIGIGTLISPSAPS
ncbi:hypothetical protein L596_020296 [Steinernema carpocapsae]|uniref:Uncharacterized protein n=1 Tax=Steinernema carpocapsae TaxID=34508 RepID=A0A4U5MTS0_STECR|nr:hypothetical protein L596_020296 [Steinernema carpocapsae]